MHTPAPRASRTWARGRTCAPFANVIANTRHNVYANANPGRPYLATRSANIDHWPPSPTGAESRNCKSNRIKCINSTQRASRRRGGAAGGRAGGGGAFIPARAASPRPRAQSRECSPGRSSRAQSCRRRRGTCAHHSRMQLRIRPTIRECKSRPHARLRELEGRVQVVRRLHAGRVTHSRGFASAQWGPRTGNAYVEWGPRTGMHIGISARQHSATHAYIQWGRIQECIPTCARGSILICIRPTGVRIRECLPASQAEAS